MYSPRIIEKTLEDYAKKNGWMPVRHTVAEVDEFNEYINSIVDADGNSTTKWFNFKDGVRLTQNRKNEIRRWILNEQYMCFADADYFATRYAYICGVGEEVFRVQWRDSQKVFMSILAEFDDQQIAIEIFFLKARQLGISTAVAVLFMHRVLFRTNTRAVMASVKQKQSDLLARIQNTVYDRLPFWLPPAKTKTKDSAPEWANDSILSIQSGSQAFGIAQGWTPSCVHISELGDIPNPKKVLEEGLFKAAHSSRNLFFVMEGTGNGSTGWQAEKWRYYKENWGNGGRFRPIFIPPACAKDLYPLPDWLRAHPIPEGWRPMEATKRMQHKSELFIRSTDYLSVIMGSDWQMGREYMWYWECNWKEAVASHTEKVWLGQMPCTDAEALQSKNDIVFNDEVIEVITKDKDRAYTPYAITGKTILIGTDNHPYEPPADQIDDELERIQIEWEAADGNRYEWELVPLKMFDESEDANFFNKLLIFKAPKAGVNYSIGVDCADGLGMPNEDRSSLSVLENRDGKDRDEQVAEFTSNQVNSPQMARIAACVAALYGAETKDERGCKFAIEQRRKPGDECQHQLKIMGFYYHHRMVMYDAKGLPDPSKAHKEGFYTNNWSRPMMLNKFMDAINTGWFKPNSPLLIRQLKQLVRIEKDGVSKIDHEPGNHDDNVFGSGMAYFTAHDMDNNAQRYKERYRPREKEEALDLRWADNSVVLV